MWHSQFWLRVRTMPLGRNVLYGDRQAVVDQALEVELSRFADVLYTFIDSLTLRVASGQRGAENMVATLLLFLEDNGEPVRHHSSPALSILTDPPRLGLLGSPQGKAIP